MMRWRMHEMGWWMWFCLVIWWVKIWWWKMDMVDGDMMGWKWIINYAPRLSTTYILVAVHWSLSTDHFGLYIPRTWLWDTFGCFGIFSALTSVETLAVQDPKYDHYCHCWRQWLVMYHLAKNPLTSTNQGSTSYSLTWIGQQKSIVDLWKIHCRTSHNHWSALRS